MYLNIYLESLNHSSPSDKGTEYIKFQSLKYQASTTHGSENLNLRRIISSIAKEKALRIFFSFYSVTILFYIKIPSVWIAIKCQRNWLFATNSDFLIPISFEPNAVNLWYFKLIFFDLTKVIVWNFKGLRRWNPKI